MALSSRGKNRVVAPLDRTEKVRPVLETKDEQGKKTNMVPSTEIATWASRLPLASKTSAAVVLAGYLLQLLAPGIRKYLALVPAR